MVMEKNQIKTRQSHPDRRYQERQGNGNGGIVCIQQSAFRKAREQSRAFSFVAEGDE